MGPQCGYQPGSRPGVQPSGPVNDLTAMVVKKKKKLPEAKVATEANGNGKRKAEDETITESKKAKVEEIPQS